MTPLVLASSSVTRQQLLRAAGVDFDVVVARLDEGSIRDGLLAEAATPRDVADALAEMKARRVAERRTDAVVIGCDQVLDLDGRILGKPASPQDARAQLYAMRGRTHRLLSAVVVYHRGVPQWRHVGIARLTMRNVSDEWLDGYISRNWHGIRHSAGSYLIEAEGVRLFAAVEGCHFSILGLPLVPLLGYLADRGFITA